jgi:hypothetical protein
MRVFLRAPRWRLDGWADFIGIWYLSVRYRMMLCERGHPGPKIGALHKQKKNAICIENYSKYLD